MKKFFTAFAGAASSTMPVKSLFAKGKPGEEVVKAFSRQDIRWGILPFEFEYLKFKI